MKKLQVAKEILNQLGGNMDVNFKISPDLHKYINEKIAMCDRIAMCYRVEKDLSTSSTYTNQGYRQALQDILQVSEVIKKEESKQ